MNPELRTADENFSLRVEIAHLRLELEARDRRIGELLVMNARLEKVAGIGRFKQQHHEAMS